MSSHRPPRSLDELVARMAAGEILASGEPPIVEAPEAVRGHAAWLAPYQQEPLTEAEERTLCAPQSTVGGQDAIKA